MKRCTLIVTGVIHVMIVDFINTIAEEKNQFKHKINLSVYIEPTYNCILRSHIGFKMHFPLCYRCKINKFSINCQQPFAKFVVLPVSYI